MPTSDIEHALAAARRRRLVQPEDPTLVRAIDVPIPGLRQVDDGELQTLAAVHGQDRDCLCVGLQSPGAFGDTDSWASADPCPEPLDKRTDAELGGGHRRMQALAEMAQIGQHPFPAAQAQQPLRDRSSAVAVSNRAATPRLSQHLAPPADALSELNQRLLAGGGEVGERSSRRNRSGRPAGPTVVASAQGPAAGSASPCHRRGEHRARAIHHRGHSGRNEPITDCFAAFVLPHQNGDVRREHRAEVPPSSS